MLYRLGRGSFRHRRLVLALWLAALAAVLGCLAGFGGKLGNAFTIPGSQSQKALDSMAEDFPAAAGTSAQIVFTAPDGKTIADPRYAAAINETLPRAKDAPQVTAVIAPSRAGTVTPDHRTALAQIQYTVDRTGLESRSLDALEKTVRPAEDAGMRVAVGARRTDRAWCTGAPSS